MIRSLLVAAAAAAAFVPTAALARPMTATDMHMMRRLASPSVSPDGRYVVFALSSTDLAANKRSNKLYVLDLRTPGAQPTLLLPNSAGTSEHSPAFSPDGKDIYFLGGKSGSDQVWRIRRGQKAEQVTNLATDVSGFLVSPTGDRIAVWADRDLRCADFNCSGVKPAAKTGTAQAYDQLFVRHWDTWAEPGVRSRLFSFPLVGGKAQGGGVPLTGALVGDVPSKPFGGGEEIAWSRDGRTIFFALREAGRIEAKSTNLDIFAAPADGSAPPTNLTANNQATDTLPRVSPDGRTLAYVAMARAGYEADRQVLMLRDLATGAVRPLTAGWDRSVGAIAWTPDSRAIVVDAQDIMENPLFRVDVATGQITRLTSNGQFHNAAVLGDGSVIATMNSVMAPDDLYRIRPDAPPVQLTAVNRALLAQLDPVTFEKFSFRGAGNSEVWGMKVKPVMNRTLPIAFIVHGGPQGSFGNGWSYRWNPRLFASPGYAVVSIDFHGSTGYGQAFTDSIRNDWGGKPLEDLKRGLKFATDRDPQLQADNACALGASYGGYMMNWIAGRWPERFRCLVNHNGVFDQRGMAYATEELWFTEWEHGGKAYYEDPGAYERWNPVHHVARWRTPMLVVISDKDYRVPYTQGLGAFTALQRLGVPSRLVRFPDENHWVLKPANSIRWYDEVFGWMNRWTGAAAPAAQGRR